LPVYQEIDYVWHSQKDENVSLLLQAAKDSEILKNKGYLN